ncbi:MAG: hypothetical protein HQ568_12045 [Calditrichaeota bacterium]|nr:hypothetical protein [Calditrichota bacterium]
MKKTLIFLTFTLFIFSLVNGEDESKLKMRVVKLNPEKTQQNIDSSYIDYRVVRIGIDKTQRNKDSTFPDYPENFERKENPNRKIKLLRNKTVIDDKGQSWRFGSESIFIAKDDTTTQGGIRVDKNTRVSNNSTYHIIKENDTLFSFSAYSMALPTDGIAKSFLQDGNYIIIYQKFERYEKVKHYNEWINSIHVVINGDDLNISRGYENSCAPCYINGQLFYLFEKNGRWGWFFDGIEHLDLWDDVFYHYGDGDIISYPDPSYMGFKVRNNGKWCVMRGVLEAEE